MPVSRKMSATEGALAPSSSAFLCFISGGKLTDPDGSVLTTARPESDACVTTASPIKVGAALKDAAMGKRSGVIVVEIWRLGLRFRSGGRDGNRRMWELGELGRPV
ncbi:hypothetical protein Emag_006868 [Eimeria magna]